MSDSSYAAGGYVPGAPVLERIPAGEWVWSVRDVKFWGAAFLAQMQARD